MSYPELISKISTSAVRNIRVTLLALLGILCAGAITYTSLMPREGLPQIAFPVSFIQVSYQANDKNLVNEQITIPIENILEDVEGINTFSTTTGDNFSFATIFFNTEINAEEKSKEIAKIIETSNTLPAEAFVNVSSIKAGSYDNKNDLILAVAGDGLSYSELEEVATNVALELSSLDEVKDSSINPIYSNVFNPSVGETQKVQVSFNRIGVKKNEGFELKNSVLVGVVKDSNVSTVELSDAVNSKVESILAKPEFQNIQIETVADLAIDLNNQISSLEENAVQALVAVAVVLFLFVSWRASLLTALFIPTVMAASLIVMFMAGITLNVISLFALILVLGLLVDDAIVVVEAIDYQKRKGVKGLQAIREAVRNIGAADVAGTLTTLIVFVPMLAISGILGEFINQIPTTVIIALGLSLTIALTIIPALAYIMLPDKKEKRKPTPLEKYLALPGELAVKAGEKTANFINFYLARRITVIAVIIFSFVILMFGSFFASKLKFTIFPQQKDSNGIIVQLEFNEGTTMDQKIADAQEVEHAILSNYEDLVQKITYLNVGRDFLGVDGAEIWVYLNDITERDETSPEIAEVVQNEINSSLKNSRALVTTFQVGGPPAEEYPSRIQIFENDDAKRAAIVAEVQDFIRNIELSTNTDILDVKTAEPSLIYKSEGREFLEIQTKLSDNADDAAIQEIENKVKNDFFTDEKKAALNVGDEILGIDRGVGSELAESFSAAGFAAIMSLILIYALLVAQFNSFTQPLLILLAIPFSFVLLFPGLYLTDNALSFFVTIGLISLMGIVVNNSIMLLDFANQNRAEGKTTKESIVEAIKVRFRPLVTTSVTTVVGLIPLALSDPFWESLSLTIIFGLISSTTLVILAFPAYYYVVEETREFVKRKVFRLKAQG
ncbi:MAG: hypothetical protein Kow0081_1940 [Candidatus Dojkabacteria bacterium]